MAKYLVEGFLTISASATVEAKSKKEAREKAASLATPTLCHMCSSAGAGDDESWELNGFDDPDPKNIQYIEKQDD